LSIQCESNPNPSQLCDWQSKSKSNFHNELPIQSKSNHNITIFGKRFRTANVNWLLVYDKIMEFLLNISFHNPIHRIGLQFGFGYPAIQSSNSLGIFVSYNKNHIFLFTFLDIIIDLSYKVAFTNRTIYQYRKFLISPFMVFLFKNRHFWKVSEGHSFKTKTVKSQ